MPPSMITPAHSRIGLVLAGGSARGAYEVGVVRYVLEEVSRAIGRPVPLDVISGTSAGSINAVVLAAFASEAKERGTRLADRWTSLSLPDVVRPSPRELLFVAGRLLGRRRSDEGPRKGGGLFDPSGIERIVRSSVPFHAIADHLREGRLAALSISTTHVATGRTVV